MAKKKQEVPPVSAPVQEEEVIQISDAEREYILLGHLIKYNLYLLAKSIVFAAVVGKTKNLKEAAVKTNEIITELDLDSKRRSEQLAQNNGNLEN